MKVEEAILAACQRGELPASCRLVVGFSGGPDSSALLHALASLGRWSLLAVHVDHGLQVESAAHAATAQRMAERWGVPHELVCLRGLKPGELAAREARHEALAACARKLSAHAIVLAHHADDQLETLIFRLVRGSGSTGLSGMQAFETGPAGSSIARPLLGITRLEIDTYCQAHGIEPLFDPTNADPEHASRNRIRHRVVPVLQELNPRAAMAAGRTAAILADEDAALEVAADQALASLRDGEGRLDARGLVAQPRALARRILRRLVPAAGFEQIEALLGFVRKNTPGHTHLMDGRLLARASGKVWVCSLAEGATDLPGAVECRHCLTRARRDPSMEREI